MFTFMLLSFKSEQPGHLAGTQWNSLSYYPDPPTPTKLEEQFSLSSYKSLQKMQYQKNIHCKRCVFQNTVFPSYGIRIFLSPLLQNY